MDGEKFLSGLSDRESLLEFSTEYRRILCLHGRVDGSTEKGQAGFGVFFPVEEYANVSQSVLGAQTNNRA